MPLLSCPREEVLLQYLSIPHDISWKSRFQIKLHLRSCTDCLDKSVGIEEKLQSYFSPKVEISSSLLKVYSRLQSDETLILKGWKLSEIGAKRASHRQSSFARSWLVRGTVIAGLGSLMMLFFVADTSDPEKAVQTIQQNNVPFAQIRFQDKNRIQVQYLKPELVQSVEFETTGRR